ncbi:MAG: hypothetical protein ACLRTD_26115 [Bacteroides sp.]
MKKVNFVSKKPLNLSHHKLDVFLTVKDVVPDTQQPDLTQQACLFINKSWNGIFD